MDVNEATFFCYTTNCILNAQTNNNSYYHTITFTFDL